MPNDDIEIKELLEKAQKQYQKSQTSEALKTIKEILHIAKGEPRIKALDLFAKICVDKDFLDKAIKISHLHHTRIRQSHISPGRKDQKYAN